MMNVRTPDVLSVIEVEQGKQRHHVDSMVSLFRT